MVKFLLKASALTLLITITLPGQLNAHGIHKAALDDAYNSRITDDVLFTNSGTMSEGSIQSFLEGKVPSCREGYTCLKDYIDPSVNKRASKIIYEEATRVGLNPWVILVTLQKEQSLVTDDFPYDSQYRTAMGYGCPESQSVCDSQYYGFYNQVRLGSTLLRVGHDRNCGNTSSFPGWWVDSKWRLGNTTSVDGKNTYLGTCATGSLYNYTPHRPDSGWLTAADGNHYYGNYNFIYFFRLWFAPTWQFDTGIRWKFEKLDGSTVSINNNDVSLGQTPSTIPYNDVLHLFYYDSSSGNLRHAYSDQNGWHFEVLDGEGGINGRINSDLGVMSFPVIYDNRIHVFYYDKTNGDLRHAFSDTNGSNWTFETLDGNDDTFPRYNADIGKAPSAAVYDTSLQLFYYDSSHGNLRHAWVSAPGQSWRFENLDGDPGSVASHNSDVGSSSTVVQFWDSLQLYYYDTTNGNLRHAWSDPVHGWRFENLDGDPGSIARKDANLGIHPSVTVYGDFLQLFYYDAENTNLRHAWIRPGDPWKFENLDGDPGAIGGKNAVLGLMPRTMVFDNSLFVFFHDATSDLIRVAQADSKGWHFADLDGSLNSLSGYDGNTGYDPFATVYQGTLQLYYYNHVDGDLMHAWGPPNS